MSRKCPGCGQLLLYGNICVGCKSQGIYKIEADYPFQNKCGASICNCTGACKERRAGVTEQCHSWCEKPNRLPFSDLNIPFKKEQKCLKCPICEKPYIVDLPATTLKLSACDKCIELAMKIENLDEEQRNAQLDTD